MGVIITAIIIVLGVSLIMLWIIKRVIDQQILRKTTKEVEKAKYSQVINTIDNAIWKDAEERATGGDRKKLNELERNRSLKQVAPMLAKLKPANAKQYANWLVGHLINGGTITHVCNYNLPIDKFYVATGDITVYPLYGVDSVCIIVPEQYNVTNAGLGGNNVFIMKGFQSPGAWVPIYNDVAEIIHKRAGKQS